MKVVKFLLKNKINSFNIGECGEPDSKLVLQNGLGIYSFWFWGVGYLVVFNYKKRIMPFQNLMLEDDEAITHCFRLFNHVYEVRKYDQLEWFEHVTRFSLFSWMDFGRYVISIESADSHFQTQIDIQYDC